LSVKNSEKKAPSSSWQLLSMLRQKLREHQAMGIDAYPASSDLRRFFALTAEGAGILSGKKDSSGTRDIASRPTELLGNNDKLELLRQEVSGCSRCHLHQEKLGSIFGGGSPPCRLTIVGDWSVQNRDNFLPTSYFGPEEDVMLWNMMAAIDLKPDDVYVTNCLKCCPGEHFKPDSKSGRSCFSYLEREIVLAGAVLICAMGEVAARMLSGSSEPLARLRGKFVRYRYQAERNILVMPTYHPRFLLRHPEMKRAAWLDLQAIKRKLSESA